MSDGELDLMQLLMRRWRTVAMFALVGVGASVAYALLAPEWFEARLAVVPSQRSANPAMGLIASLPGAEALGVASATDVQRIQAVLTSNSVADEVIAKFKLDARYGTSHVEQTRQALSEHCTTLVDRKSGVVALTCEDREPEVAMQMAAFFGDVGNRVFGRISASSAREERRFLEGQVVKARHDVDDASTKLREFQEQHKIVDLPEQSKATISAMASVKGQLVTKELELSYISGFSSGTEANVVQLRQQIAIMQAKLKELEDSYAALHPAAGAAGSAAGAAAGSNEAPKFFPDAMRVPELRYELEQLLREQKIAETVFFLMTQRYETAKVDEARDTSTFQILDNPTLPTFRSRPKRRRLVLLGLIAGIALASIWIAAPTWWQRRRSS